MEALFDVFNADVVGCAAPPVSQSMPPPIKKQKIMDRDAIVRKTDQILNNEIGPSYLHSVCTDNSHLIPLYAPARDLSYEPYAYQKIAAVSIDAMFGLNDNVERGNILVSSPTGSGKSFLIQHAALRAAQENKRLIVGVPLVALAEQTFSSLRALLKPFQKENDPGFSKVGIRTGPSEMFPDADILVCTYEIIAINMALSIDFLDNTPVLILDEIHYMTDRDRGARVEYIASSLREDTSLIGLSGTIPNAPHFAHSMQRCNGRMTRLIGLAKRPIRLRYYCTLGGEKLTEICHNRSGSVEQRWKKKAWDYVGRTIAKRPNRLNPNQLRGRMLQLVKDLQKEEKLPAMVVSFSCKQLNQLGEHLHSIDLVESHNEKSFIHQQFNEVRKRVGEEEWPLFRSLVELAKRGVGIHHSQNPKLYLEVLPKLVQRGLMPLVLATSSLSTGIDLPVRSIVILSLVQPGKNGFRPIEPSLLQQIFGRAGRPGQEEEGNAILAMWTKMDQRVDVPALLCAPSRPVVGHGMVQPREILTLKIHHGTAKDLLLSPFSSRDTSHAIPVLHDMQTLVGSSDQGDHSTVRAIHLLEEARRLAGESWRYIDGMACRVKKGDTVVVDPDKGLAPVKWTVASTRPLKVNEYDGRVPNSWVFDCVPNRNKKIASLEDVERMRTVRANLELLDAATTDAATIERAYERFELEDRLRRLEAFVSVESHPLYDTYTDIIGKLVLFGFIKDGVVTYKGRMVPGILGCDDPLCLVEAWTKNLLPRDTESRFAMALSCFLQNHRHNQPADHSGIYAKLCELQRHVGDENDLGTNMMDPVRLWVEGKSVYDICQACENASPGHVCKTILRLHQLLEQLQEAAGRTNDDVLSKLCDKTIRLSKRGLPFVLSMYLK